MARTIQTRQEAIRAATFESTTAGDSYADRLIKLIPGESLVLFATLSQGVELYLGAFPDGGSGPGETVAPDVTLAWLVFGLCLVLTPLWLWRVAKVAKPSQLVLSTLAFVVWAFTIGASWFQEAMMVQFGMKEAQYRLCATFLLPVFTFLVPVIAPGDSRETRDTLANVSS